MNYTAVFAAPFAHIGLVLQDERLLVVDFIYDAISDIPAATPAAKRLQEELQHYLADPSYLPRCQAVAQGTTFQQKVWQALRSIPAGETRSYGQLAKQLQSAAQAVGNACRANPLPLFTPCHRVVAQQGLGGFGGHTDGPALRAKQWLLRHEGVFS